MLCPRIRVAAVSVLVGITMMASTGVAEARPVLVEDCLNGDALPSDTVGTYDAGGVRITLRCGSPISTGVLHIDAEHPIGDKEFDFLRCVFKVFENGAFKGQGNRPELVVWDHEFAPGRFAEGVYDKGSGDIVTVYTRGAVSNDWAACEGNPET